MRLYDDGTAVDVTVTPGMVLADGYELRPMVMEKALALHWGHLP